MSRAEVEMSLAELRQLDMGDEAKLLVLLDHTSETTSSTRTIDDRLAIVVSVVTTLLPTGRLSWVNTFQGESQRRAWEIERRFRLSSDARAELLSSLWRTLQDEWRGVDTQQSRGISNEELAKRMARSFLSKALRTTMKPGTEPVVIHNAPESSEEAVNRERMSSKLISVTRQTNQMGNDIYFKFTMQPDESFMRGLEPRPAEQDAGDWADWAEMGPDGQLLRQSQDDNLIRDGRRVAQGNVPQSAGPVADHKEVPSLEELRRITAILSDVHMQIRPSMVISSAPGEVEGEPAKIHSVIAKISADGMYSGVQAGSTSRIEKRFKLSVDTRNALYAAWVAADRDWPASTDLASAETHGDLARASQNLIGETLGKVVNAVFSTQLARDDSEVTTGPLLIQSRFVEVKNSPDYSDLPEYLQFTTIFDESFEATRSLNFSQPDQRA